MTTFNTNCRLGIITLIDEQYNYVWSNSGSNELRFPLNAEIFVMGETVKFIQTGDISSVQLPQNCMKLTQKIPISLKTETGLNGDVKWKAKTKIVFPPEMFGPYRRLVESHWQCQAIAHSQDFGPIAVFSRLEYKRGPVYEADICRIPVTHNRLIKTLNILFCIVSKRLTEVTNPAELEEVSRGCPWNVLPSSARILQSTNPEHTSSPKTAESVSLISKANKHSENSGPLNNRAPQTGIVIRIEEKENKAHIWSKKGMIDLIFENHNYIYQVGTFLECKVIEEACNENPNRKSYTAYEASEIDLKRLVRVDLQTITAQGQLTNFSLIDENTEVKIFKGQDEFFGWVLFPYDTYIIQQLKNGKAVEVFALLLTSSQHGIDWFAFAIRKEGSEIWEKLKELPPDISPVVDGFYPRRKQPFRQTNYDNAREKRRFRLPPGWKEPLNISYDKIVDVLGIVVKEYDGIYLISTRFGIAKHPKKIKKMLVGTWLKMQIVKDERKHLIRNGIRQIGPQSKWCVVWSEKITPALSTRLISQSQEKNILLLCGIVFRQGATYENRFLGTVLDDDSLIPTDVSSNQFFVEIVLNDEIMDGQNILWWKVVKYHGSGLDYFQTVPLEISVYSRDLGETMDDAHTILIDKEYPPQSNQLDLRTTSEQPNVCSPESASIELDSESRLSSQQETNNNLPQIGANKSSSIFNADDNDSESSNETVKGRGTRLPIFSERDFSSFDDYLKHFRPRKIGEEKIAVALVVRKTENYALIYSNYSNTYGLAIALPQKDSLSPEEFLTLKPGKWCKYKYCKIEKSVDKKVKNIITGIISSPTQPLPSARTYDLQNGNEFVQVKVPIDFTQVQRCEAESCKFYVNTMVGNALLDSEAVVRQESGKKEVWITHIRKMLDCHWIVHNNSNSNTALLKKIWTKS